MSTQPYEDSPTQKTGATQYFESVSSGSSNPHNGGLEMADIANKNTAGAPVGIVCTEEHLGKTIFLENRDQPYAEHGPLVDPARPGEETVDSRPDLAWSKIRHTMREAFSEFFGTFIIIMFGDGVVAQVVLSKDANGSYQSITWGWGIGVMLGVYSSGISGAHLNPAVTFANCLYRKFPWRKFPIYLISQVLGAAVASLIVFANYRSAIQAFEGGNELTVPGYSTHATGGIFCTYPASFMTKTGMFFSEFIASTLLMFLIYALKDDGNIGAGNLTPLGLFFIIFGIGCAWGWETGYAINLARDFGPRLMSYGLGYGHEVWSAGGYYFWIPMVAPFFGCSFGGFLYDVFLFTGESPINTPWLGLKRVFMPKRTDWSTHAAERAAAEQAQRA